MEDCLEYIYQDRKTWPTVGSTIPQAEDPGLCKSGERELNVGSCALIPWTLLLTADVI